MILGVTHLLQPEHPVEIETKNSLRVEFGRLMLSVTPTVCVS